MDRGHAAAALLALAVCFACSNAAPTASDQTALEIPEGPSNGCYYNFQHYGEGDRIMTNEPCLNCTCHNRMLMCYLRVCPFTKPIGQDCTIEKRADQCCPIVTCPDVPVDLLTSTSTSSPAEYGATGLGKLDKYGCSIHGKYFPEGSKVPSSPNKPCEHCYCIRNMTTCVMQECTLHVDGCTPIYHKDVCCPVRYSCDHPEDEIPLLDDMTTTVRPTPGFLLTTTTISPTTQPSQSCIHEDQVVPDGALIKTEKACEHCYCMKGDIVCVVQECGTPMENEGKNCTSLPPRQGQCCPDTYICEGDELSTDISTIPQDIVTVPPRRVGVEGSGYRNEPDEPYTGVPPFDIESEGSGEEHLSTLAETENSSEKGTQQIIETSTIRDIRPETSTELVERPNTGSGSDDSAKFTDKITTESSAGIDLIGEVTTEMSSESNTNEEPKPTTNIFVSSQVDFTSETPIIQDHIVTSETPQIQEHIITSETPLTQEDATTKVEKTTRVDDSLDEATLKEDYLVPQKEYQTTFENAYQMTTQTIEDIKTISPQELTTILSIDKSQSEITTTPIVEIKTTISDLSSDSYTTTFKEKLEDIETTSVNPIENEIHESDLPISQPGRIPGEGDCLLNSITYENNSVVPSMSNCHTSCRCISSIIKCDPIICSAPPEYMKDCQPIYDSPESCCPTYVCSTKETIPPESHNQMSGLDSTKPVLASECSSSDCGPLENNAQPITPDCQSNDCTDKSIDSSQDTLVVPCEGNDCKIDESHKQQPDDERETPAICKDNECIKPVKVENECNDSNCKTEPVAECLGSDCDKEFVTESALPSSTIHKKPEGEVTLIPDATDKIETLHDNINIESSSQGPFANTELTEVYITEPIKSSTDISEEPASYTEEPQIHKVTTITNISDLPDQHSTSMDKEQDDNGITDDPLREKEQNVQETTTLPESFVHKVTEADYSNEVVHETISENKYQTISDADIQRTTILPEQTTTKPKEQTLTDNQIITTELNEIKFDQTTTPTMEEAYNTYLPVKPEDEYKETSTAIIDDSQKVDANSVIDLFNTESPTTENILTGKVTIREHPVADVVEDASSSPALDKITVGENIDHEKPESDTMMQPIDAFSTEGYEHTSKYPTISEQEMNTKLYESNTSPSLPETDISDKVTDSLTITTESVIEVTEMVHTTSNLNAYKPVSETTYDISTSKIESVYANDDEKSSKPYDTYTETSPTEETKLTEQKTDVTEKSDITEKTEYTVTEGIKEPVDVTVDHDQETSLLTTESIPINNKPIDELKTTESHHATVTSGPLIDETDLSSTPEDVSTNKIIETNKYPITEPSETDENLYTNPPASIVTINDINMDSNSQELLESDKKTTEIKTSESDERSSTPLYSIPDDKIETITSSLDVTSSVFPTEKDQHILTDIITTEIPEKATQTSVDLSTFKVHEELTHTQSTASIEQHDSYTTEKGYADTTSQLNEQDKLEIPSQTTTLPLRTEENITPVPQDEKTTHDDSITSDKQDIPSDSVTTQKEFEQGVPIEYSTSSGVTVVSNIETTTNVAFDDKEHKSESPLITDKDVELVESNTKPAEPEYATTNVYEDVGATDSSTHVHVDEEEKPNMHTKPQFVDAEHGVDKIELSTKPAEILSSQDITTEKQDLIEVNIPTENFTETPSPSSIKGIKDDKISDVSESYTISPEKTDTTTELLLEIDTETTTPKVPTSIEVVSTAEPEISGSASVSVPLEESPLSTTSKSSDINIELTTAKEALTDTEQATETVGDQQVKITSSPSDDQASEILDHKIELTTETVTSGVVEESATPIEGIPTKQQNSEITTTVESTTQMGSSNLPYTIPDVQSSSITKDIVPDSMAHKDDKLDSQPLDDESLHTKLPEQQQQPDVNTEKYQEHSGEPIADYDNQQNVVPLEVSTLISVPQDTEFTPTASENLSSPDSALSLVTDKPLHAEYPPESTLNNEISTHDLPVITTESLTVSQIDQMLISTDKSIIGEAEVSPSVPSQPVESDIKTTSDKIKEHLDETTTQVISDATQEYENNEKLQTSITEKDTQLFTKSPEPTLESHSITTESIHTNVMSEVTTNVITEKENEVEAVTKESAVYTDNYETTIPTLSDKEVERQPSTKEPLPTISVLIDNEGEKVTEHPTIYSTAQSSNQLYETTTTTLFQEKGTESESGTQKVTQPSTIISTLHEITTISSDVVTEKEVENLPVTEESDTNKDLYDKTTKHSLEQATEKESEYGSVTIQPIPSRDVSETSVSTLIENQTEKETVTEAVTSRNEFDITTIVTTEKQKDTESPSVTKASPGNDGFESTTSHLLDKETLKENELEAVTEAHVTTNDIYETTSSILPEKDLEKEISSVTQLISSSSEPSVITSDIEITTFTYKIPELTDDTERTTVSVAKFSETTPYHVELQEHTHQPVDHNIGGITSIKPIEEDVTTEHYISEEPNRGDIPHKDDNADILPTSHYDDDGQVAHKEEIPFTTPTYVSPEKENVHNEDTTESDQTVSQISTEKPEEDDKYSVIPKETEKPLSQNTEIEIQTEKHIPDEFETPKPEILDEKIVPLEEATKATTLPASTKPEESTIHSEEFDKPEERPVDTVSSTDLSKPELNEPSSDDLPAPDFPTSGGGYGQEPDYGDSEDQAFGPGTCRYGGKVYVSAQQIPRDDPCDFCFCFRSDIICLQQSCPPPIHGCHEEPIQGFCCPRYECPVSMATTLNVTTTTTTTTTTLPPHFLPHAYKGAAQRRGCQIKGHTYKVGEVVRASSGPCLHCTCGGDGQMKCDPKACTPEPMLRQMIAAAVSAKRRR